MLILSEPELLYSAFSFSIFRKNLSIFDMFMLKESLIIILNQWHTINHLF